MTDDPQGLGEMRADVRAMLRAFELHTQEEREYRAQDREDRNLWLARLEKRLDDHGKRLTSVEHWKSRMLGVIGVLSAAVSSAFYLLVNLWTGTRP